MINILKGLIKYETRIVLITNSYKFILIKFLGNIFNLSLLNRGFLKINDY